MFDSTRIVISFLGIAHYLLISVSDWCGIKLEAEQDLGETSETRESQWLQVRKLLLSAEGFFAHTAHTPLDTPLFLAWSMAILSSSSPLYSLSFQFLCLL